MTAKTAFNSVLMIITIILIFTLPSSVLAAEISLKLGHIAPAGRSTHDISAQKFAQQVEANTGGKVSVKVFPHGQLGRPAEHWSQLSAGAMDLFVHDMTGSEMVEPKPKNFQILLTPYLFESQSQYHTFLKSDLLKTMMAKVEKAANVKFIGYGGDRGPRGFTTTDKKITEPSQMKGIKIRTPPAPPFVSAYKGWGASPTPISPKELYSSLKTGMVVGVDIDLIGAYSGKFYEIQKYFTAINWLRSGVGIWMNADKWNSLDNDMKAAIMKSAQEAAQYTNGNTEKQLADARKGLTGAGVEIISPDLEPWKKVTAKSIAEKEGKAWEKGLYQKIKDVK